jgi:hypothetical protein
MRLRLDSARTALVALALLTVLAVPAAAQRKAFVVGNSAYVAAPVLPNPANDARDIAETLKGLDYQVTVIVDATRKAFLEAFQTWTQGLKRDDLALIFFAGHGLQIGGENYLFPVDAKVESEADARQRLVPLNALLADVSRVTKQRIVILDACRNNPFAEPLGQAQATRSAGVAQGLARVYAGVGSYIAFSTQPGNVALDGTGRNSPFAAALKSHIGLAGVDVHAVMRRVRGDVQRATGEQQVPWENSSLVDEVMFAGRTIAAARPAPTRLADNALLARLSARAAQLLSRSLEQPDVYHYVSGLDPKGDNFLALRAGTDASSQRIATLGPDTLLKVVGESGAWRKVVLRDGTSGWAHSNWIKCCRTETGTDAGAAPLGLQDRCEKLWLERNYIWHRHGYCFTTSRAKEVFGTAGCSRDQAAASAAMTPRDRTRIDELQAQEKELGCR